MNEGKKHVRVKAVFVAHSKQCEIESILTFKAENVSCRLSHSDLGLPQKVDFVVKVEVEMFEDVETLATGSRKRKSIAQDIAAKMYKKMAWTDFVLQFEEEEVACHRVILA